MNYEMKLRAIYFDKIKSGEKIYEIRLNDERRKDLKVGDTIVFKKEPELNEELKTVIQELLYFSSFNEMALALPLEKIGFANVSVQDVVDVYHQFYSKENEKKYGVVAIKVRTI